MQIYMNIPTNLPALRYFLLKNPKKLLFSKDYITEYSQIAFKAKSDFTEERDKHKITKDKLIAAQKELSTLKREKSSSKPRRNV